jgi:hypothetical protein
VTDSDDFVATCNDQHMTPLVRDQFKQSFAHGRGNDYN